MAMKKTRCISGAAICLVAATAVCALTPLRDGERVLWVGNSFSDWFGPITQVMGAALAKAGTPRNVTFYQVVRGMGTFKVYYTEEGLHTLDSIRSGHFTKMVLQGYQDAYRNVGGDDPASFVDYGTRMVNEAKSKGMECVLFWPHFENWEWGDTAKERAAKASYDAVAAAGALVAPAYKAWQQVIADKGLDRVKTLLYHDIQHQGPNGMLLNMFVMYTVLTGGTSGVGLRPDWPEGIINANTGGERYLPGEQDYLAGVAAAVGKAALGASGTRVLTTRRAPLSPARPGPATVLLDGRALGMAGAVGLAAGPGPEHARLTVR